MDITCISDLHGEYPELPGGDLLIVAGDLTLTDTSNEIFCFLEWLERQPYDRLVFIGGNHDNSLIPWISTEQSERMMANDEFHKWEYLIDSGTEFDGLKIWGSPWTRKFAGQNPHCMAFALDTEEQLAEKWALIPKDVDILVTHSPPFGLLDQVTRLSHRAPEVSVGSKSLQLSLYEEGFRPKLHVFGHIHEGYGFCNSLDLEDTLFVNASHMSEYYEPVNKPIRIEYTPGKPMKVIV